MEFKNYKISEISSAVFSGGTPNTKNESFWNGELMWLSSGETRRNFIFDTEKKISFGGVQNSSTRLAKSGSLVIASAGQGYTRGQTSMCMCDMYINQSLICIECDPTKVNNFYLYYKLRSMYSELRTISDGNSIRGSLTTVMIKNFEVSLPSLENQRKIAKILYDIDLKIEVNNQLNDNFQNLSQELYKRWFVDFEFPDENGKPYKSYGGKMVETEIGKIPEGWKIKKISEIVKVNKRGLSPKYIDETNDGIPVINQRCIRDGIIIEEAVQYHDQNISMSDEMYFNNYDILINSMGVGTLGRVSQMSWLPEKRLVHSCITILRANEKHINQLVFGAMIKQMESYIEKMGNGTTGQTSLKNKDLGDIKVVCPPLQIQEKMSKIFKNNLDLITNKHFENENLIKLRDTLLPKLMNGEIDLDKIEI